MTDPRVDPPFVADERAMLEHWLEWYRQTLEVKCAGLTGEQLCERSCPPSTLSLLGLVRHMADVERNWFRRVLAGQDAPGIFWSDDDEDGDILNAVPTGVDEAFTAWHAEIDAARTILADLAVDDVGQATRRGESVSVRWVLVHMIEEYARHCGHADLLRERVDGVTGE
jgi:uncharacterized damage-inducible protein DinB